MKRKIQWLLINGLFCVAIYFGFFKNIPGAQRIVTFWVTIFTVLSFFMFAEETQKKMKDNGRVFPAWVVGSYDTAVIFSLIWFGAIYAGIAYALHSFLKYAAFEQALSTKKEQK